MSRPPESGSGEPVAAPTSYEMTPTSTTGFDMIPTMPFVDHGYDEKSRCWAVSLPGAPGCIAQGPTLSHAVHALVELFPKYLNALHEGQRRAASPGGEPPTPERPALRPGERLWNPKAGLGEPVPPEMPDTDRIYPCDMCGVMRSKNEGGTVFTVCDDCWKIAYPSKPGVSGGVVSSPGEPSAWSTFQTFMDSTRGFEHRVGCASQEIVKDPWTGEEPEGPCNCGFDAAVESVSRELEGLRLTLAASENLRRETNERMTHANLANHALRGELDALRHLIAEAAVWQPTDISPRILIGRARWNDIVKAASGSPGSVSPPEEPEL